jgi:hypothetical protein
MLASFLFLVGQSLDVNMNLYGSSVTKKEATQKLFAYWQHIISIIGNYATSINKYISWSTHKFTKQTLIKYCIFPYNTKNWDQLMFISWSFKPYF